MQLIHLLRYLPLILLGAFVSGVALSIATKFHDTEVNADKTPPPILDFAPICNRNLPPTPPPPPPTNGMTGVSLSKTSPLYPACGTNMSYRERVNCSSRYLLNMVYRKLGESIPAGLNEIDVSGRVIASITIDRGGRMRDPQILRGLHPRWDAAVLQVLESLADQQERWEPASDYGGTPMSYQFNLPIRITLE